MLDWIYPQVVETVNSPINGLIKILKLRGQYSAWVGGFEQSGSFYVQKIWKKKLGEIKTNIESGLVLGLGCGTVAKLLFDRWPDMAIVGVEIDPVMIRLGKKYFGLDQTPKLKIVKQDGFQFVKSTQQKFDLILLDAYIGNQKKAISIPQRLLTENGAVITNNLIGLANELVIE